MGCPVHHGPPLLGKPSRFCNFPESPPPQSGEAFPPPSTSGLSPSRDSRHRSGVDKLCACVRRPGPLIFLQQSKSEFLLRAISGLIHCSRWVNGCRSQHQVLRQKHLQLRTSSAINLVNADRAEAGSCIVGAKSFGVQLSTGIDARWG